MNEPKENHRQGETSCIFCKITKGEIPCDKVFENKNFLVFLDIKPVNGVRDGEFITST
jgi:hypothetical protein